MSGGDDALKLAAGAPSSSLKVFREPAWKTRLTVDGVVSFPTVKVVRAAPLSQPERYISFLDGRGEEICMVDDLGDLDEASRAVVEEDLANHYLTAVILRVRSVRNEFGTSYWDVGTDLGPRDFVVQNVGENARWLGPGRLLLIDVDGNRFEIPDMGQLDKRSAALVGRVL